MPDQKDVAEKLKERLKQLTKIVKQPQATDESRRLGLIVNSKRGHLGLSALRTIFQRQFKAQLKAHKLPLSLLRPPKAGTTTTWDSAWMSHMTMWLDAMIDEVQEVRGWLNWKSWKQPKKMTKNDLVNARLELIDLLHFWVNAYTMLGGDEKTVVVEYHAKRDENDDRQKRGY